MTEDGFFRWYKHKNDSKIKGEVSLESAQSVGMCHHEHAKVDELEIKGSERSYTPRATIANVEFGSAPTMAAPPVP